MSLTFVKHNGGHLTVIAYAQSVHAHPQGLGNTSVHLHVTRAQAMALRDALVEFLDDPNNRVNRKYLRHHPEYADQIEHSGEAA